MLFERSLDIRERVLNAQTRVRVTLCNELGASRRALRDVLFTRLPDAHLYRARLEHHRVIVLGKMFRNPFEKRLDMFAHVL